MALFEEKLGCDVSAGPDIGIHLADALSLALNQVPMAKLRELLHEQLGNLLSEEEVELAVESVQLVLQDFLASKVNPPNI